MKKVFLISTYQPTSGADSTSTTSSSNSSKQQQRGKETGGLAVSKLTNFLSSLPNLSLTTTSTPSLLQGEGEEPAVLIVASKDEELIFSLLKQYRNKTQMNWRVFFVIFNRALSLDAYSRSRLVEEGANMISGAPQLVAKAVKLATLPDYFPPKDGTLRTYNCPVCGLDGLSEDGIVAHTNLFHVSTPNRATRSTVCPICRDNLEQGERVYAVHIRNMHGPAARGELEVEDKSGVPCYAFSLVVCRRPSDGRFLLVQEVANRGWWLPGGRVEAGEDLGAAAVRETKEEAGVDVKLTGILRVEHSPHKYYSRLRVIYLAEPKVDLGERHGSERMGSGDDNDQEFDGDAPDGQEAKTFPDYESMGAAWVLPEELRRLYLRGDEPALWIPFVAEQIAKREKKNKNKNKKNKPTSALVAAPLSILTRESSPLGDRTQISLFS